MYSSLGNFNLERVIYQKKKKYFNIVKNCVEKCYRKMWKNVKSESNILRRSRKISKSRCRSRSRKIFLRHHSPGSIYLFDVIKNIYVFAYYIGPYNFVCLSVYKGVQKMTEFPWHLSAFAITACFQISDCCRFYSGTPKHKFFLNIPLKSFIV